MNPRITISWLACTKKGVVVAARGCPADLRAFIAEKAKQGVTLIPAKQTIKLEPVSYKREDTSFVSLDIVRGVGK